MSASHLRKRGFPIRASFVLAGVAALALAATVLAAGTPGIGKQVIGGGGGHAEAGSYVLDATIGQAVVGTGQTGAFALCSGFWCDVGRYRLYLPVVLRD